MTKMTTLTTKVPSALLVVLLAGLLVGTGGCANTNNRDNDSRGATLLILDSLTAAAGGGTGGTGETELLSDVCVHPSTATNPFDCATFNDIGIPSFRNEPLDPNENNSSFYEDIQMYRVRVVYTRTDGRNREGIDVPWSFDSSMDGTVGVGQQTTIPFTIVRHLAKVERPLVDLVNVTGDEGIIYTNTRCDFWGRDIAGNDHHVYGFIPIAFADFADSQ